MPPACSRPGVEHEDRWEEAQGCLLTCRLGWDEKSLWEASARFQLLSTSKSARRWFSALFALAGTFPQRADCLSQSHSHHGQRGQRLTSPKPCCTWQIDGETVETVADFMFLGSKITADGDCSHEIKGHLLLGRKVMTNLESMLKSRDIVLLTKVRLVKAMVFPVVMYGCESWTIKKTEHLRTDAFELWCWRRLLRVPWTARRSIQSILKEISPECSLEGLRLKLKLQYFAT